MKDCGFMDLDFALYFEPENGIQTQRDFTDALLAWAKQEKRDITILEESMEPKVALDGKTYVCRLAEPALATQNNPLRKALGLKGTPHSIGGFLGYKWVYLYEV